MENYIVINGKRYDFVRIEGVKDLCENCALTNKCTKGERCCNIFKGLNDYYIRAFVEH